jgi:hypothetical protein
MKRLISVVARWKLGYSSNYLQSHGPLLVTRGKNRSQRHRPHTLRWEIEYEGGKGEDDGWSTDDTSMGALIDEWNNGARWEGFMDGLSDDSGDETEDEVQPAKGKKRGHDEFVELYLTEADAIEEME